VKIVAGLFAKPEDAQQTVSALRQFGLTRHNTQVTMKELVTPTRPRKVRLDVYTSTGLGVGASVGGILGMIVGFGALARYGVDLTQTLGTLGSAFTSSLVGAWWWGATGALIGLVADKRSPYGMHQTQADATSTTQASVIVQIEDDYARDVVRVMRERHALEIEIRDVMLQKAEYQPYIAENDTDVEGISYEDFRKIWGDQ
jgi:hypothetical protein